MEMSLNTSGPSYCESKGEQFAWEADNAVPDDKKFFKRYVCYTPKNYHLFKAVENRMQQCCAAHIVRSCQHVQYCSALVHLIAG